METRRSFLKRFFGLAGTILTPITLSVKQYYIGIVAPQYSDIFNLAVKGYFAEFVQTLNDMKLREKLEAFVHAQISQEKILWEGIEQEFNRYVWIMKYDLQANFKDSWEYKEGYYAPYGEYGAVEYWHDIFDEINELCYYDSISALIDRIGITKGEQDAFVFLLSEEGIESEMHFTDS